MNDPSYLPEDQPQIDARANLFYFLQALSGPAWGRDHSKSHEDAAGTSENIETDLAQNATAL